MDNSKRNVHNSGPLGMLVKSGYVKKVEPYSVREPSPNTKPEASYFKTPAGLEFAEHELLYVDPKECEPWKYANRQEGELGNMDELISSIQMHKQLQPALVRKHPQPHNKIQYEIIFGRRRHAACLHLGIPFLVILKEIPNIHDAIASQDAENKFRNDVSAYSNAILYRRLLDDGIFQNEKELANKLNLATSSLNDLMAFTKIPESIVNRIPNIYILSKSFALKIVQIINKSDQHQLKLFDLAPHIGETISSPAKLEKMIETSFCSSSNAVKLYTKVSTQYFSHNNNKKLFTFKYDHRGLPCFVLSKELMNTKIDLGRLCQGFKEVLEQELLQSGYPD